MVRGGWWGDLLRSEDGRRAAARTRSGGIREEKRSVIRDEEE
jgi:hypothetical protein